MALIDCPECGKQISDKATACPHCGIPGSFYQKEDIVPLELVELQPIPSQLDPDGFNVDEFSNALVAFHKDHSNLINPENYIDKHATKSFLNVYAGYFTYLKDELVLQYVRVNAPRLRIDEYQLEQFVSKMTRLKEDISSHNEAYVNAKLEELRDYFDHIMDDIDPSIRLDAEQRRAIVTDDNYCLLIAGAGAGKTTTMAAKVKYLVEKRGVSPEDIIVISYTNKAIGELKERINSRLKIPARVATFHAFAFDIIKKASDDSPDINFSSYNIIFEMLAKEIYNNQKLMKNLVLFMGYYFNLPEDAFKFNTLEEYHLYKSALDYETLKSGLGEYIHQVADSRSKYVRTLTGEFLRSSQEVQIANFLYLNGIEYSYEKPYPNSIFGSRKKYTPDFFICQGENEAYIEHYGLTQGMRSFILSPQALAKYQKSISDKRTLHKRNETKLIETWSFYGDRRPLVDHLKDALTEAGFIINPRDYDEVYRKIVETGKDKYIFKLVEFVMRFIEQYKTSGYGDAGFNFLRKKTDNVRTLLFLDIVEEVYLYYQKKLADKNQIDFPDMINQANELLADMEKQGTGPSYKYIVIDEFQDIARQRFNLTKRLSNITKAKVIAVGDDWQSIYAFAGSDITLFTKFIEMMGSGTELKINHTYRNSQELIDIAGAFIQKNSSQIKKQLVSPKRLNDPIRVEFYHDLKEAYKNLAKAINSILGQIINEFGENSSILMIGRYNFDLFKLQTTGEFQELNNNQIWSKQYPKARIHFMTAHSSKGLGFDNVIILNMIESRFGFPSQLEEDPIMRLVTHEDISVPFAEERRLFYVALTRTKNRVYIAAPLNKPSRFLIELIKDHNLPHPEDLNLNQVNLFDLRCPLCGYPLDYQYNRNYGLNLYTCSNEPEVCDFMTNDRRSLKDIFKCPKCSEGYMIVKRSPKKQGCFYGCTNYSDKADSCRNIVPISES